MALLPAVMLGVLALLRFYPLARMNYSGLIMVIVVLGWLAYQYLAPLRLVRRRALLDHVTVSGSAVRRWLWNSTLSKIVWTCQALVVALLVLILTARINANEWWVLCAGVLAYPFLLPAAGRLLAAQIQPQYRLVLQLRVLSWLILIPVTLTLVAMQWFWADVSDTRTLSILTVVTAAFSSAAEAAALPASGWLLGLSAALDQGLWHLMQLATSAPAAGAGLKAGAWLVFLAVNAVKVGLLWVVLSGVAQWLLAPWVPGSPHSENGIAGQGVSEAGPGARSLLGGSRFTRSFNVTMLLLFVGYLALLTLNAGSLLGPLRERVTALPALDPCRSRAPLERQRILDSAGQALTAQQQQMAIRMEAEIDRRLDEIFRLAEPGVEHFLDWNFSLRGQYTQLMYMGVSTVGETNFADYIAQRMNDFVYEQTGSVLGDSHETLQQAFVRDAEMLYLSQAAHLEGLIEDASCVDLPAAQVPLSGLASKSAVGAGSGAGIIAARAGMRIGSRAVGRGATSRLVAATAARFTARLGTSSAAGAAGTWCGPLVLVCAPALAIGAWVATDLAINEVDDALNRERMREDMLAALAEEKAQWKQNLVGQYQAMMIQVVTDLRDYQQQRFNIPRDGLQGGLQDEL